MSALSSELASPTPRKIHWRPKAYLAFGLGLSFSFGVPFAFA
jgi:hypothetical protein